MRTLLVLSLTLTAVLGMPPRERPWVRLPVPAQMESWESVQRDWAWLPAEEMQEDAKPPLAKDMQQPGPLVQEKKNTELVPEAGGKPAEVEEVPVPAELAPLVEEEPAELVSVVEEVPAELVPVVQEEPAELVSVVQEEPAELVSVVQEEPAELVSVVQEEPAELVSVVEESAEIVPVAEEEVAKEFSGVEPEMGEGLEGGAESEAEMQLTELLPADRPTGQEPTNGKLSLDDPAELQKELAEEEPIVELEPFPEQGLGAQEQRYAVAEEPIAELEPEMWAGHAGEYPIGADEGIVEEEPVVELMQGERSAQEGEYFLVEQPIVELEPETEKTLEYQPIKPEDMMKDPGVEGHYYQFEEPIMELEPETQGDPYPMTGFESVTGEEPVMELEPLAGEEFLGEAHASLMGGAQGAGQPLFFEGSMMDGHAYAGAGPQSEGRSLLGRGRGNYAQIQEDYTGWRSCHGVVSEGKCYQFFPGPKKASDAELFCQAQFPAGHLASITGPRVHTQLMDLMLRQNGGYTRTWVGGLRYLETGRFIWLDGSHWTYDDFLSGKPSSTADVGACIELQPVGKGKFNDTPCWNPRAFICSYPL